MEIIQSISAFEQRVTAAGLGPMDAADLERLKHYYDGAATISTRLFDLVRFDDEPATTFHPGWINPLLTWPEVISSSSPG